MPVRLLEITNDFPPTLGGIENYAFSLASGWEPAEVVVLARLVPGSAELDRTLPFEVVREPARRTLLPTRDLFRKAAALVRARSIDVVHFASPLPLSLLGPRLLRSLGVPYAATVHGGEFVLPASLPAGRALLRRALSRAAVLLPVSAFTREAVVRLLGTIPPCEIVTPGVDPVRFSPAVSPAGATPAAGPVIVSVSRLVARKGPATLIRALPEVRRAHPPAHALIVGGGPDLRRLQRLASSLGVREAVTFAGPQPWAEVPRFYRAGDVFALPTRERFGGLETEGFPLVYLEAAACGLPAVAGDAGGVRDAVADGETGFVVDGGDAAETAGAIRRLLDDPELARDMGQRARARVLEGFTWDTVVGRVHAALERHAR